MRTAAVVERLRAAAPGAIVLTGSGFLGRR
jgi:hypothetical protein